MILMIGGCIVHFQHEFISAHKVYSHDLSTQCEVLQFVILQFVNNIRQTLWILFLQNKHAGCFSRHRTQITNTSSQWSLGSGWPSNYVLVWFSCWHYHCPFILWLMYLYGGYMGRVDVVILALTMELLMSRGMRRKTGNYFLWGMALVL